MKLGLYKNHFFIDEEIDVSAYWINHYTEVVNGNNEKLKQVFQASTNISRIRGNSVTEKPNKTTVGLIFEAMMEQNLFEEIKEVNQFNYKTVGK